MLRGIAGLKEEEDERERMLIDYESFVVFVAISMMKQLLMA